MKWIILIIAVLLVLWLVGLYNGLITKRNRVKNSWAQIDVQLKRRFDLIPNLIETVKGYAKHEAGTFESVTKARTMYTNAATPEEAMKANAEMTGALGRLFAVAESYPELKANTNFLQLQEELTRIEDKIGFARQFYNDTALTYNNAVQMFPSNIFANMFGFREEPYFQAEENEKTVPQVKF